MLGWAVKKEQQKNMRMAWRLQQKYSAEHHRCLSSQRKS
jgi:hypothetical protein